MVNNRYGKVKFDVLLGKGEEAFSEYSKYNTNISFSEIFGVKKGAPQEEMYNYFVDILKKQQGPKQGK